MRDDGERSCSSSRTCDGIGVADRGVAESGRARAGPAKVILEDPRSPTASGRTIIRRDFRRAASVMTAAWAAVAGVVRHLLSVNRNARRYGRLRIDVPPTLVCSAFMVIVLLLDDAGRSTAVGDGDANFSIAGLIHFMAG
jgi:hypothetical protein